MHLLKVVRFHQEQHGMNYAWQMLWNSMVFIRGMEITGQVQLTKVFTNPFALVAMKKVKYLGTMTFDDFTAAAWECREEFAADHMKSAAKYLQIHPDQREKQGDL